MPKSYTDNERNLIISQLRQAAWESMLQKGVTKTTVDDLVKTVHIPKGTFYLFYKSKELLLYDAISQVEDAIHQQIAEQVLKLKENLSIDSLTDLLLYFFTQALDSRIFTLMTSGELDILMRKLPDEIVKESISKDDDFLLLFCELFPNMPKEKLVYYSGAFRALFFTIVYKREIGDSYDQALRLLIKGVVIQMWEDKND